MEKTIYEIGLELEEDFEFLGEWAERYMYLIEMGKSLEPLEDHEKNDSTLVQGCQSRVWLVSEFREGSVFFRGDSDALITKGLLAVLTRLLSGHAPDDIIAADLSVLQRIGLRANLSPARANGLTAMIGRMKQEAAQCATENASE